MRTTLIMKSQTRHKDILARQSENTLLSIGDNEKVSCLGLHISIYEFITENGDNMTMFRVFSFFATLWGIEKL